MNNDHPSFVQTIYYLIFGTKTNKSTSSLIVVQDRSISTLQEHHVIAATFIFKSQDRNILKLYGVTLKQTLRHLMCCREDETWMGGNADWSVELKRRWMKAKLR